MLVILKKRIAFALKYYFSPLRDTVIMVADSKQLDASRDCRFYKLLGVVLSAKGIVGM